MKQADFLSLFNGLSSAMKRTIGVTVGAFFLAAALVFFVLLKQWKETADLTEKHQVATSELTEMYKNIAEIGTLRKTVDGAERRLSELKAVAVLEPLLGSYEMRALRQVAPLAAISGVDLLPDSVRCTSQLPIQGGEAITGPFYMRQVVEFSGSGAYTQIVAFVEAIEANLPMVSVSSIRILGQQRSPENHAMMVALEWPVLAENTAAEAKKKKK